MNATPLDSPRHGRTATLLFVSAVTALATLGCGLARTLGIPWLSDGDGAAWIVYPGPADTRAHPAIEVEGIFRRSFELPEQPRSARLRVRAFRTASITLNGRELALPSLEAVWPEEGRAEVGPFLRPGANDLSIVVTNRFGPPALWIVLELPGGPTVSDGRWEVSRAGAAWCPATMASDRRRGETFDPDGSAERLLPSLSLAWPWLLAFFTSAFASVLWIERWVEGAQSGRSASRLALPALSVVLGILVAALLLNNAGHLPRAAGFDAEGHLAYIRYIQERGSLPLADEGWQMYQPPLYYLLASFLLRAGSWSVGDDPGVMAIRLLNLILWLANLALIFASLRLLFPESPRRQAAGIIVAAFLPASLLIYHFPTNEALAITLSSGVFWATLRLLRAARPGGRDYALVGTALGAALLAKFSSLLLVPALFGSLLGRRHVTVAPDRRRRAAGIGALVGAAILVCGWHYARVAVHFGTPLVWNLHQATGFAYWVHPGNRMAGDYLHFGGVFSSPLFSGLAGIWDGFYSTLWGDGLCSGVADLPPRPPWSYELMATGFALALLPTAGLLLGAMSAVVRLVRRPDAVWGLITGSALITSLALVGMTLTVPSYAMVKAFYGLVALVPLCALAACGIDRLAGPRGWRPRLVFASLGLWALTSFATFWVPGGAARTQVSRGMGFIADGKPRRAAETFQAALASDAGSWNARLGLANLLVSAAAPRVAVENLLQPSSVDPPIARRRLVWALLLARDGALDEARKEADRGLALNPDLAELHLLRGALTEAIGDLAGAVAARREALRINPFDATNHQALERLYTSLGDTEGAGRHRDYARKLDPAR